MSRKNSLSEKILYILIAVCSSLLALRDLKSHLKCLLSSTQLQITALCCLMSRKLLHFKVRSFVTPRSMHTLHIYVCFLVLVYRNWMNSLAVKPYVNYLYIDLRDGLIVLQLYDIIEPGIVDWTRVHKEAGKLTPPQKLKNCNYAVKLGKRHRFLLNGAKSDDLLHGNHPLAFVRPIMLAYMLAKLSKRIGKQVLNMLKNDIVDWVNNEVFR